MHVEIQATHISKGIIQVINQSINLQSFLSSDQVHNLGWLG